MHSKCNAVLRSLAVVWLVGALPARADDRHDVFGPEESPFGASYPEWAASWWQWALASPVSTNPVISDPTGEHCAIGQTGGPVWFLAGNRGTKKCTIPAGNAILVVPISFVYCAFADDLPVGTRSIGFVRSVVDASGVAQSTGVRLTVDGKDVGGLRTFLASSPIFSVDRLPPPGDAFFGATPANLPFTCVTQGWFVLLRPPAPGPHTIRYAASSPNFSTDVTYEITVSP